eukprot:366308-Chlamydomonas_euryale.AAC.7
MPRSACRRVCVCGARATRRCGGGRRCTRYRKVLAGAAGAPEGVGRPTMVGQAAACSPTRAPTQGGGGPGAPAGGVGGHPAAAARQCAAASSEGECRPELAACLERARRKNAFADVVARAPTCRPREGLDIEPWISICELDAFCRALQATEEGRRGWMASAAPIAVEGYRNRSPRTRGLAEALLSTQQLGWVQLGWLLQLGMDVAAGLVVVLTQQTAQLQHLSARMAGEGGSLRLVCYWLQYTHHGGRWQWTFRPGPCSDDTHIGRVRMPTWKEPWCLSAGGATAVLHLCLRSVGLTATVACASHMLRPRRHCPGHCPYRCPFSRL